MELSENALKVLEKRYLKRNEDGSYEEPEDMFWRVARTVGIRETEEVVKEFYQMMVDLKFLPNSPTLRNAGRGSGGLSACFGFTVKDSMEDIFNVIKITALTHKFGGGTGINFSELRPEDDVVKSTNGVSSGPISFMKVFSAATDAVTQGCVRRGANLGLLRVDHPDIVKFIKCKDDQTVLTNFNISVGITDEFMEAVKSNTTYSLINPRNGEVVNQIPAQYIFNMIVKQAWKNGEPGLLFVDTIERGNLITNEKLDSVNPCGEQTLFSYESCNLGSINLVKHLNQDPNSGDTFDWKGLEDTVRKAVTFLDDVISVNSYPVNEIESKTKLNRKIGLGVMGWADALIELGIPYNSEIAFNLAHKVMEFINAIALEHSLDLSYSRGVFPNWENSLYKVLNKPVHNATRTTIAPTGTLSLLANCSSSIEPLFALVFERKQADMVMQDINPAFKALAQREGFWTDNLIQVILDNKGSVKGLSQVPKAVQELFVTAHDISYKDHIKMQATFQEHTDNAISKTINFSHSATEDDISRAYLLAYESKCKGVTVYRDGSRDEQVLSTSKIKIEVDTTTITKKRPIELRGHTYEMQTGCGSLYVTINHNVNKEKPFEVFITMGKAGGCASAQCETIGRIISTALRSDVDVITLIKQLRGISCHKPIGFGGNKVLSCADAVAKALLMYNTEAVKTKGGDELEEDLEGVNKKLTLEMQEKMEQGEQGACPECGGQVKHEGGCSICIVCGHDECA